MKNEANPKLSLPGKRLARAADFEFDVKRDTDGPVMHGKLAIFNDWVEIDNAIEGHFMERIARGAFAKTIQEQGERIKVLFQHGTDNAIGKKPLGSITRLEETAGGVEYEVKLLDAPYVEDLIPGLEAGVYGSSFLADDVKSETTKPISRSDHNPEKLPETTRQELRLYEFGPVTFPSYQGASAHLRSVTEEVVLPGLREFFTLVRAYDLDRAAALTDDEKPETPDRDESTSSEVVSRSTQAEPDNQDEEVPPWYLK